MTRFSRRLSSLGGSSAIVLGAIALIIMSTTTAFVPLQQPHPSTTTTTKLEATKIPSNTFNNVPYSNGFRKGTYSSSTSTSSTSFASVDCNFSDFLHQDSMDEVERMYQESFGHGKEGENDRHKACDVDWTRAAQEVRSYAAWRRPKTAVMQKYNPQFDYGPVIDVRLKP